MSRIANIAATAALVMGVGGISLHYATQSWAAKIVDQRLAELVGGGMAERGAVDYSILDDSVTVEDVRLTFKVQDQDPVDLVVAKLTMVGMAEADGKLSADHIVVENATMAVEVPFPSGQAGGQMNDTAIAFAIEKMIIDNYNGRKLQNITIEPDPDVAALADATFDFYENLEFDYVGITNLTYSIENAELSEIVTVADLTSAGMKDGILAISRATDMRVDVVAKLEGDDGISFNMTIDEAEYTDTNMGVYRSLFFPTELVTADTKRIQVAGGGSAVGIRFTGDYGLDGSIASVSMDDFRMRPLPVSIVELAAMDEDAMDEERAIELISNVVGIFKIGSMEMRDLQVATEFGKHVELASISTKGWGYIGFDEFSLKGLKIGDLPDMEEAPFDTMSLASIEMKGFDFEKLFIAAMPLALMSEEEQMAAALDLVKSFPPSISYSITGIDFSKNGQTVAGISEYSGSLKVDGDTLSGSSEFALTGVTMSRSLLPEEIAQQSIDLLGYDQIVLSISGGGALSQDGSLGIGPVAIALDDGGELGLSINLVGLALEKLSNPEEAILAMSSVALNDVDISYQDDSLVERGLGFFSTQSGMEVEQARGIVLQTAMMGVGIFTGTKFGEDATGALESFINKPGKLSISARPVEPVPVMNVMMVGQMQPQAMPEMLNLSISAE